ncbi:MAG: sulfatase-like hydrolase/transferase [Holophagales bacterium]|nr:sulfatase-like hydrolase/transferase [Holophagales bacterium]
MRGTEAAVRFLGAVLLLGVSACSPAKSAHGKRNLVLITMDTTRVDRLGCYGSTTSLTPNIDSIAAGGTVFEHAFAVAPVTGPSHASMLSGTFPPFHQVHDNDLFRVPKELTWLPSILKDRGYETAGIVAGFPLRAAMGFARGFDYYGDHLDAPPGSLTVTNLHTTGVASRRGDRVSAEFRMWLERNKGREPFFVWLHYFDPHYPYDPPRGYEDLNPLQPYDGEVAFMDDCIGTVLRALSEAGLADRTGMVVAADHGEGLMDHGELTHALLVYNSTLHVPLIVRLPWMKAQQHRVRTFVSGADVAPTVLDALGIVPDATTPMQARSLLPLLSAAPSPETVASFSRRPLCFETLYPLYHYRWSPLSGFLLGGRKYIHGPTDELYDLETDMAEAHDLAATPQRAAMAAQFPALKAALKQGRPGRSQRSPTREEIAQLRSLGYLGSVSADDAETLESLSKLPSPASRMETFFRYDDILSLALQNRLREALEQARAMADADPKNKDARSLVAGYYVRAGLLEAADGAYSDLVRDFADKDVLLTAGSYFLARRDLVRARQCLERIVADDPTDVEALTRLGDVAAVEGARPAARRLYEQALGVQAGYREALLQLAVLLDRDGLPQAEARFVEATEKYPFDPRVSFAYGVYLVRHGRRAAAPEYFRRAAALSSGSLYAMAQFALASWYRQEGELENARTCLRELELRTTDAGVHTKARAMLAEMGAN